MQRMKQIFSTIAIGVLSGTSCIASPVSVLTADLDNDGSLDSAKIVHTMPMGAKVLRILPEDGSSEGVNNRHDYVQIETAKHATYIMDFPFVEKIELSTKTKDADLKLCSKRKSAGLLAIGEEGAVLIYYKKGRFLYKPCFE